MHHQQKDRWKIRMSVEPGLFWTCIWTFITQTHKGTHPHQPGGCFSPQRELERGTLWNPQEPDQPALLSFPLCLYSLVLLTLDGGVCLTCACVSERVCVAVSVCKCARLTHMAIIPSDQLIGESISISEVPLYALQPKTVILIAPSLLFLLVFIILFASNH